MNDPEPLECAGCLRKISAPDVWLCDECVSDSCRAGVRSHTVPSSRRRSDEDPVGQSYGETTCQDHAT
jgi:hypothetical protein